MRVISVLLNLLMMIGLALAFHFKHEMLVSLVLFWAILQGGYEIFCWVSSVPKSKTYNSACDKIHVTFRLFVTCVIVAMGAPAIAFVYMLGAFFNFKFKIL